MTDASTARARRRPVLAFLWAGALGAALLVGPLASPASGADPTPTPEPTATPQPTPTPTPIVVRYSRSLLHAGDFVRQYTRYQCVGASLQTMRNMIWKVNNRGPYLQKRLWKIARAHSLYRADGGADPFGWTTAAALSKGYGRYVLVAAETMTEAVNAAAKGIATTGRPAGIIVWGGTHAWVITGFEATADPNETDDYRVVTIRMADPLWPYFHVRRRTVYRPGTRISVSTLKRNFTAYHDARRDPRIEGQFVIVVPVADGDPIPDGAWVPAGVSTTASAKPAPTDAGADRPATPAPTPTPDPTPEPTALPTAADRPPAPLPDRARPRLGGGSNRGLEGRGRAAAPWK